MNSQEGRINYAFDDGLLRTHHLAPLLSSELLDNNKDIEIQGEIKLASAVEAAGKVEAISVP